MALVRTLLAIASLGTLTAACYTSPTTRPDRAIRLWRTQVKPRTANRKTVAPKSLDETQALALAAQVDVNTTPLVYQAAAAKASAALAGQFENPEFRVRSLRPADLDNEVDVGFSLRFPVPNPWLRSAAIARAEAAAQAIDARVSDQRQQLRATVRRLFAQLAYLRRDRRLVDQAVADYKKQAQALASAATRVQSAEAAIRGSRLIDDQVLLKQQEQQVRSALSSLLGLAPDAQTQFVSKDLATERQKLVPVDVAITSALKQRTIINEVAHRINEAQADRAYQKGKRWPWFRFLQFNYDVEPGSNNPSPFSMTLAIDLPLLSWNGGGIQRAEARLQRRLAQERQAIRAIADQVRRASATLRDAQSRVERLKKVLGPALKAADRYVSQGIAQGVVDPIKAQQLARVQLEARRRLSKARYQLRLAHIAYEQSTGAR